MELLEAIFFITQKTTTTKKKQTDFTWNCLETPIQVCRGASILYFSEPYDVTFLFRGYLNRHFRIYKMINSVDYQSCPSSLASMIYLISINFLLRYPSPEYLLNFLSNLYIPICGRKLFKLMVFTFLENALNLDIFTHGPPPHSKIPPSSYHHALDRRNYSFSQAAFFRKSVSHNSWKRWRKLWFTL